MSTPDRPRDTGQAAAPADTPDEVGTYVALRIGLVLLVVLLAVAIGVAVLGDHGCVLTSLSAYYYTPVRSVFVVALGAIGVCLMVYAGSTDLEDVLLNGAGFLAVVVAFVPVPRRPLPCTVLAERPGDAQIVGAGIANNVTALLVVGFLALGAGRLLGGRAPRSPVSRVASGITVLALAVGAGFFVADRDDFARFAHFTAAIALFAAIFLVVVINSVLTGHRGYRVAYRVLAGAMVVGFVVPVSVHGAYWVLAAEVSLTGLFALYWGLQTAELRSARGRTDVPASPFLGRSWTSSASG